MTTPTDSTKSLPAGIEAQDAHEVDVLDLDDMHDEPQEILDDERDEDEGCF